MFLLFEVDNIELIIVLTKNEWIRKDLNEFPMNNLIYITQDNIILQFRSNNVISKR